MQIKKAAEAAGLTERAVRLYEERGLISPVHIDKNGRDFRDYSDDDVRKLKTIASLRRALFTIEEIKEMTDSPDSIPSVVSSHRERMHADFENLSYLVDQLDLVDEGSVTSIDELSGAIFSSPTRRDPADYEPTEEEKILFSEQYRQIYEKYFSENTGWERRYDASLKARGALERVPAKLIRNFSIGLIAAIFIFFIIYGIADVEEVEYELDGFTFYAADETARTPSGIRIEGRYKNYLIRDDMFEGIIYIDSLTSVVGGEPYQYGFAASRDGQVDHRGYRITQLPLNSAYDDTNTPRGVEIHISFDTDFELDSVAVLLLPTISGNLGSYSWTREAGRAICASRDGGYSAYALYTHYDE